MIGWYDPNRKTPTAVKIAQAAVRYEEKRGHAPTLCLTNPVDATEAGDHGTIEIRGLPYVPRHTYYLGTEAEE